MDIIHSHPHPQGRLRDRRFIFAGFLIHHPIAEHPEKLGTFAKSGIHQQLERAVGLLEGISLRFQFLDFTQNHLQDIGIFQMMAILQQFLDLGRGLPHGGIMLHRIQVQGLGQQKDVALAGQVRHRDVPKIPHQLRPDVFIGQGVKLSPRRHAPPLYGQKRCGRHTAGSGSG